MRGRQFNFLLELFRVQLAKRHYYILNFIAYFAGERSGCHSPCEVFLLFAFKRACGVSDPQNSVVSANE